MYLMGFGSSRSCSISFAHRALTVGATSGDATSAVAQAGPYIMLGGVIELLAGIGECVTVTVSSWIHEQEPY